MLDGMISASMMYTPAGTYRICTTEGNSFLYNCKQSALRGNRMPLVRYLEAADIAQATEFIQ